HLTAGISGVSDATWRDEGRQAFHRRDCRRAGPDGFVRAPARFCPDDTTSLAQQWLRDGILLAQMPLFAINFHHGTLALSNCREVRARPSILVGRKIGAMFMRVNLKCAHQVRPVSIDIMAAHEASFERRFS